VADVMARIPAGCTVIISGGAGGVDELARLAAEQKEIPCVQILPDYPRYGKRAPLMRNVEIVERADLVLAFWDFASRGTASVLEACIWQQVSFEIIGIFDAK
jgi:predicted Rossmann-fold nucleotide-binding protein